MNAELFLTTPATHDPASLARQLAGILEKVDVSAVLVPRRDLDEPAYADLARAVLAVAQAQNCAVLLDNDPQLARRLGADGVHAGSELSDIERAISALKPDMIVGVGPFDTRHDAMQAGELGVDYVLFGSRDVDARLSASDEAAELARWWAETFEVPSVLFEPSDAQLADARTEFVGYGPAVWQQAGEATQMLTKKRQLQTRQVD